MVLTSEYVDDISWCDYCGTYTPQSSAIFQRNKFAFVIRSDLCEQKQKQDNSIILYHLNLFIVVETTNVGISQASGARSAPLDLLL